MLGCVCVCEGTVYGLEMTHCTDIWTGGAGYYLMKIVIWSGKASIHAG